MLLQKRVRYFSYGITEVSVGIKINHSMKLSSEEIEKATVDIESMESVRMGESMLYKINYPILEPLARLRHIGMVGMDGKFRDEINAQIEAITNHCFKVQFIKE